MNISSELRDRNLKAELGDNLCARAADEIERLTAQNERLRALVQLAYDAYDEGDEDAGVVACAEIYSQVNAYQQRTSND